jgi:hypothetical protein
MNREECLDAAMAAVRDRPAAYGAPENNFERIAALWNAHVDNLGGVGHFNATDVAIMLALLKIARLASAPEHTDSWVDLAGYAACGAEVSTVDAEGNVETWKSVDPSAIGGEPWVAGQAWSDDDAYEYGDCTCASCMAGRR